MNDTFLYIHSFSKKKKVFFILSDLLFLYHLFGGLYVLLNWFHSDLWFTVSDLFYNVKPLYYIINLFSMPIAMCAYFIVLRIYMIVFPVVYFILNLPAFYKKRFNRNVMLLDTVLLIVHPQVLIVVLWIIWVVSYYVFGYGPPFIRI